MKFELPSEIVAQAVKLQKGFPCLETGKPACSVTRLANDGTLFVECGPARVCPYHIEFGQWCICSMPVRKEIFNRFKV